MTKIGTITLYSEGGELVKKWEYLGEKIRSKIIEVIRRHYAGKWHYYEVHPYLNSHRFEGGCLLPGTVEINKRLLIKS